MLNTKKVISTCGISFGTSGARGLVSDFTPQVCAAFTYAFVDSLRSSFSFDTLAIAIDNRPSSHEMAMACAKALEQQGIKVVYYGVVPTPALAYVAMQDNTPCIMVTGSHIPFDRNGLKFYRPDGEITKVDEQAIISADVDFSEFEELSELPVSPRATEVYIERYASLFEGPWLEGKKIGIYEHSSAGRDIYAKLFTQLGADVVSLERSDNFIPIDTEAVSVEDRLKAKKWSEDYGFDAIFSTDGDGDRPLVADESGEWLRGDILGLLCSRALHIDALAVPVSCNTIIANSRFFSHVELTKIGSPYVIAEFSELAKQYTNIAGFEANGGYLLGSDINVEGSLLKALPTRDALLPALMLLASAGNSGISALVAALPERYTYSDRVKNFATEVSQSILSAGMQSPQELIDQLGFEGSKVAAVDSTDGLRVTLDNKCIIHLRPSGNAPELRCYAEADSVDEAIRCVQIALSNIQCMRL